MKNSKVVSFLSPFKVGQAGNLWTLPRGFLFLNYILFFSSSSSDTAFCQNQNDLKWYLFDDNSVSEISEQAVVVSAVSFIIYC